MTSSCNGRDDSSKVKVFFHFILNHKEILLNKKNTLFFLKIKFFIEGCLKINFKVLVFKRYTQKQFQTSLISG